MKHNEAIIHLRTTASAQTTPPKILETGETSFTRIYTLLRMAGHDSVKAAEILRDARYNDAHARIWIKTIAASRRSARLPPSDDDEYNRRARLILLAYEVLGGVKTPAGGATEGTMLSLLSQAFRARAIALAEPGALAAERSHVALPSGGIEL